MWTPRTSRRWLAATIAAMALIGFGPVGQADEEAGPEAFPDDGLMPKVEIGADRFLAAHPEADGRGITVAIFDTGVDPGAAGLQTTSDGRPKIVDLVDGSGSGDVDTTTVRKAEGGVIKGASGRPLKLGKRVNPTGRWHVGVKPAYEMFPGGLVRRLKTKRRKVFAEAQRAAEVGLERRREALRGAKGKDAQRERGDLKVRFEQLQALWKAYADPGPIYDCVVYHDGSVWRALIDTDEDGDLADEKAMTNYRLERQWSTFSSEDRLNYGINIYSEGKRLSIVVDCGAHGTHVAGIVAAHYPDRPALNGIAPGAQIVAVKIGDTRLRSSSTGTGEERGLIAVRQNKCDLINMSYGGPTATPNRSRMDRLYAEIVNEQNVIFVASAGNEGPALTTVGAPGGTTSEIFGVGAYVSPRMMRAQYAMRKTVKPTHFTWSSRGPTADGDLGVDFSAPGGAIAPVPNWLLQGSTQMNGTSMSSPNLCGGVALMLSGLKQKSIQWSPHRIHRALSNTAKQVEGIDVFGMGRGIVQIPEAFDYVERWRDQAEEDVRFDVRLPRRENARGLYLREPAETNRVAVERVSVKPHFAETEDHASRIAFSMRLRLEATQPWIETADHMALQHGGGRFEIRVDPTQLATGAVHHGEVHGIDVEHPERGAIFRLPVTVIRPQTAEAQRWQETLSLEAGSIERRFFAVPDGATWADLRIRTVKADSARLIVLQTQQLLPGHTSGEDVYEKYIGMDDGEASVHSFAVTGGRTLEVALAQYWSSLGAGTFEAELVFHGLKPSSDTVLMAGSELITKVDVSVPFGRERLRPAVKLTTLRKPVRPSSFAMTAGDPERDVLTRGRVIHDAVYTFKFSLKKDAKLTPRSFLSIYEDVYESWSSGLWMVFDENKRRVGKGPLPDGASLALAKGSYVLRLHLRHEDPKELKAFAQAPLLLDFTLSKPVSVSIHPDGMSALRGGSRFAAREARAGDRVRLFLKPPSSKQMGSLAEPGNAFLGEIHYGEEVAERFGKGRRPGGWPIVVIVPDPEAEEDEEAPAPDAERAKQPAGPSPYTEALEELFQAKLKTLASLRRAKQAEAFAKLSALLLEEQRGSVAVLVEQLKWADRLPAVKQDAAARKAVIAAAERVLKRIDRDRLAQYRGSSPKQETKAEKRRHRRMTMRGEALAEALHRKARAQSHAGASAQAAFLATWRELERWADVEGSAYLDTRIRHERARGRLGKALAAVAAKLKKHPRRRSLYEARIEILRELGFTHWVAHEQAWMGIRFPSAYPPF